MQENTPYLIAVQPLEAGFERFERIDVTSEEFSIGRGRSNSITIPYLSISRNHCVLRKHDNGWTVEDKSSIGIYINGVKLEKGVTGHLKNGDMIILDPSFVFKFKNNADDDATPPASKRMKLNEANKDFINDMRIKFEESQNCEMRHIAEKIYNTQQRQTATKQLKEQLKIEYEKKLERLESEFALEIDNLKGEIHEVHNKRVALEVERDMQVACVRKQMEEKIEELKNRINQHTDTESELIMENNILKEKLLKEREEFLAELSRECTSKQELLQNLEAKIKEQEDIRIHERQELEEHLRIETEQLKAIKENELKELAEQKIRREEELLQELSYIKQTLEGQVEQMELQRCQAEEQLIIQMREMKKTNEEDKEKMKQLILERQNIENKLNEAQQKSEQKLKKLRARVSEREVELAALASERIQKQAEQSSEVINSLQAQLEKVKSQLESVQNEKNELLACIPDTSNAESSTKQSTLAEVGELMENELQCSICAELFVGATTLNCSHTFCKYCITVWKRKKKECPICRAPIASECKSLVLDSFIDKMVQNLTEETKQKRAELLKSREAEVAKMKPSSSRTAPQAARQAPRQRSRRPTVAMMRMPTVDLTGMSPAMASRGPEASANSFLQAILWGLSDHRPELRLAVQSRRGRSASATRISGATTSRHYEGVEIIDDQEL